MKQDFYIEVGFGVLKWIVGNEIFNVGVYRNVFIYIFGIGLVKSKLLISLAVIDIGA